MAPIHTLKMVLQQHDIFLVISHTAAVPKEGENTTLSVLHLYICHVALSLLQIYFSICCLLVRIDIIANQ